jgi:hypothetical protein
MCCLIITFVLQSQDGGNLPLCRSAEGPKHRAPVMTSASKEGGGDPSMTTMDGSTVWTVQVVMMVMSPLVQGAMSLMMASGGRKGWAMGATVHLNFYKLLYIDLDI